MAENYYQILGVRVSASDAEIKAAYKKLAVKFHPDKNGGSKYHEEKFKEVSAAYQTLSDRRKRAAYDYRLIYGATGNYAQTTGATAGSTVRPHYRNYRRKFSKRFREPQSSFKVRSTAFALLFTSFIFWYYIKVFMDKVTADEYFSMGNYEMALHFDDNHAESYFMRAEAFHRKKDYSQALYHYNKAIQHAPSARAEYYFARAMCLLQLKKFKDSLADFKTSTHLQPLNDTALYIVGDLHTYIFNEYEEGILAFEKAVILNPDYYDALFGKGYCYLQLDENDKALETFDLAYSLNSEDASLYYYRGFSYIAKADTLRACSDWNNSLLLGKEEAREVLERICGNKVDFN
jgi:curved DNA-binding protein CbpA